MLVDSRALLVDSHTLRDTAFTHYGKEKTLEIFENIGAIEEDVVENDVIEEEPEVIPEPVRSEEWGSW